MQLGVPGWSAKRYAMLWFATMPRVLLDCTTGLKVVLSAI